MPASNEQPTTSSAAPPYRSPEEILEEARKLIGTESEMSYVDMRGMPSRTQVVEHYAELSGRQVDDLDYYLVLAKWKLAIVLEQGFQRAGDDEKLLAYGPVIVELMRSAADLAESSDYR